MKWECFQTYVRKWTGQFEGPSSDACASEDQLTLHLISLPLPYVVCEILVFIVLHSICETAFSTDI